MVAPQHDTIMTSRIIFSTTDPFLTTKEAAQCLGVTLRTVQLWVNDGRLQAARTPGRHRRIRTSDVRALQEAMGIKPAKAVVLLTDEQIARAYCEAMGTEYIPPTDSEADQHAYSMLMRVGGFIQAAVLAANGLGADHA